MELRSCAVAACALGLALGACRTERVDSPAGLALAQPLHLEARRAWRVLDGGEVRGVVVCFGALDGSDAPSRRYFSVRNALQQELGHIDGLGRAWRFEVHAPRPTFVGSGTVIEGARAILSLAASAVLAEVSIGENAPRTTRD